MDVRKELIIGILGALVVVGIVLYYVNQYNLFSK